MTDDRKLVLKGRRVEDPEEAEGLMLYNMHVHMIRAFPFLNLEPQEFSRLWKLTTGDFEQNGEWPSREQVQIYAAKSMRMLPGDCEIFLVLIKHYYGRFMAWRSRNAARGQDPAL